MPDAETQTCHCEYDYMSDWTAGYDAGYLDGLNDLDTAIGETVDQLKTRFIMK